MWGRYKCRSETGRLKDKIVGRQNIGYNMEI
jgi:hypothetical protein